MQNKCLASVTSKRERDETALGERQFWIGGTFDGNWTWTDGETWEATSWDSGSGYPKQESKNTKLVLYESGLWRNYPPKARFPFVCKATVMVTGVQNRTFEYTADDLKNTRNITVQWKYQFPGKDVLAKWENPKRGTGFNISWHWKNMDVNQQDEKSGEEIWKISNPEVKAVFTDDNVNFVAFVNMAQQALEDNMDHLSMMEHLKGHIVSYKLGYRTGECQFGQTKKKDSFLKFHAMFNITYDETIYGNISTFALKNGFELYSTLLHCPDHKHMDLFLQEFFSSLSSPRELLQGASNVINSGILTDPVNIEHLNHFCKGMQSILGVTLKDVLSKTLSSDEINILRKREYPFLVYNQISGASEKGIQNGRRKDFMAELSSHPVHLKSMNGTVLHSAFIPFCAYKTDLLLLGEHIDGLDYPVCNKFTPTVLDGQLCYTLDISSALPDVESLDGKEGELTLLLDYNKERSVKPSKLEKAEKGSSKRILTIEEAETDIEQEARIFIHTLKPFSGHGAGSYKMSSLKRIYATEDFLNLPPSERGCTNTDKQRCLTETYLQQKRRNCSCIPWEFPQATGSQKVYDFKAYC